MRVLVGAALTSAALLAAQTAVLVGPGGARAGASARCGGEQAPCRVSTERQLRAAWGRADVSSIILLDDIFLRQCRTGDPIRESGRPLQLDGRGHTLRQTCFEKRLLRQDGTGPLRIANVTLTRGGTDGPGAALTSRGEVTLVDSTVTQNLSEEPGGGVFSMRRITAIRCVITGNLANDDGGGLYARRGGVRVVDSIVSSNLVDGSGGAIGSTGDIVVIRSHVDGNTTDGDGGALYTDEDGDVTVIDSTVDGSTADGPGGAIFTVDGDVTVVGSTLNGNRADDRGGAIAGEGDVTVIDSTVARNEAVAHVAGGIWARGNMFIANSTISDNYAEGQGGGILGAGTVSLFHSTVTDNIAPVAANVGAGSRFEAFGSVIGPGKTNFLGGQVQATAVGCRVNRARSHGYNVTGDASCGLGNATDMQLDPRPALGPLADNGGRGETQVPLAGSLLRDRIPAHDCGLLQFRDALAANRSLDGLVADRFALLAKDARGVRRPQGPGCEIGAVEVTP